MSEEVSTLIQPYIHDIFASNNIALKDHPQISLIIDILTRKEKHNVFITHSFSERINLAFLSSIALCLKEAFSHFCQDIDFIYFDKKRLNLNFHPELFRQKDRNKRTIVAMNEYSDNINVFLQPQNTHDFLQFIIFADKTPHPDFVTVKLIEPTKNQLFLLLKTAKLELEAFHRVIIPDETVNSALSLAEHYLGQHYFDKAFELLDSASARATLSPKIELQTPIVSRALLDHCMANITQIPATHLHSNLFQANKFTETLQKSIYGQDEAIATMALALQQACIKPEETSGPLCNFLLVGSPGVGKASTAFAMAEHLFGHKNALLCVDLNENFHSISDLKVVTKEKEVLPLLTAIQKTPYAIVLIENIQQIPVSTINLFKNIFTQGYAFDETGIKYDFHHAIIVVTTTLGAERINSLVQAPPILETNKTLDLIQLVLNEHPNNADPQIHTHLSSLELCEELLPTLESFFSSALLQHFTIIPFLPLDYSVLEKIIRGKIKILAKRLENQFRIELNYAPEVIKFLAHEAFWRKPTSKPLEKVLEQHLYSAVANEIFSHADNKNRPKRLLLQLNDDGQLLRCEFITPSGTEIYHF